MSSSGEFNPMSTFGSESLVGKQANDFDDDDEFDNDDTPRDPNFSYHPIACATCRSMVRILSIN